MEYAGGIFACPICGSAAIETIDGRLNCLKCKVDFADVRDGVVVFDGCEDKEWFFEKQAIEKLTVHYADYDSSKFRSALEKRELWEMDIPNKKVGIAKKFWWEEHVGVIKGKDILEVGCGVNYIVPYWLQCGNDVVAFDICKGSVDYLRNVVNMAGVPSDKLTLAVADATAVGFAKKFDVININNVLHHISDKDTVFRNLGNYLKDDGMLLITDPNYYYPPRWIVETDMFDPFNFIKNYFVKNSLIEKGEKAVIFSKLKRSLANAGYQIKVDLPDTNYISYFSIYWLKSGSSLARLLYYLDKYFVSFFAPRLLAPFEYIIAAKSP